MTLVDTIQLGLRKGYNQNLQFQDRWSEIDNKMIEYLLTVSVAAELYGYGQYGNAVQILIEHSLSEFRNNAFPRFRYDDTQTIEALFGSAPPIKRKYNAGKSSKRIDIAVTYRDGIAGIRSLYGIEIKAINQSYKKVKVDIIRLADSMITTDPTDNNSITVCYAGFIKSYKKRGKKGTHKKDINNQKRKINSEIEELVKGFVAKYPTLNFQSFVSTIHLLEIEELIEAGRSMGDQDHTSDNIYRTGLVSSVVIEITKN